MPTIPARLWIICHKLVSIGHYEVGIGSNRGPYPLPTAFKVCPCDIRTELLESSQLSALKGHDSLLTQTCAEDDRLVDGQDWAVGRPMCLSKWHPRDGFDRDFRAGDFHVPQ